MRFWAAKCITRHLVSFDMNKSYRPGFLVFVIIVKGACPNYFCKQVKMTFRGWGVKMRDVSRLLTEYLLRAHGRRQV